MDEVRIIQGGMGVAVSSWRLARAVARTGQLGVVSGTALDVVLARRLQSGDPHGHLRRALDRFPFPAMAARILDRWYVPGGKSADAPFRGTPVPALRPSQLSLELTVLGNFVEVTLAKEGHGGLVGINFLEKIQLPTLPALYGALLAGVDVVLMGAGIPRAIPGILDDLCAGRPADLPVVVQDAPAGYEAAMHFDPREFVGGTPPQLGRPRFLPIVASSSLASMLLRRSTGRIDGFVVEGWTAGGHNAPPRGRPELSPEGEPVYGPRDVVDPEAFVALGLPFWMAGSQASAEHLAAARAAGAAGIQVGTAFAFCSESGLPRPLKRQVIERVRTGSLRVRTDPVASPTGFPFKVLDLPGSATDPATAAGRARTCDLGYLRSAYIRPNGTVGWRCPAEPVERYVAKGGDPADTADRVCLCNGLSATIGLGQVRRDGRVEPPLFTSGDDLDAVLRFLPPGATHYRARDVIRGLLVTA